MREGLVGIVASMRLPWTFGEDPRLVHFIEFLLLLLIMI